MLLLYGDVFYAGKIAGRYKKQATYLKQVNGGANFKSNVNGYCP